jgi:glycosyl transferase, family 25
MIKANFIDHFDKVYVINLPNRSDRREEIEPQLNKIGLSLNHPKVILFNAIKPQDAGEFESIGARGCFLSHLGVLKDAKPKKIEKFLIFEDDLNLSKNFIAQSELVLSMLKSNDWDIFYGDYRLYEHLELDKNAAQIVSTNFTLGNANFVGFKGEILDSIISYLETMLSRPTGHPLGGPMHVDGAYTWFRKDNPNIITIVATPILGFQRSSTSDIAKPVWKDKVPFVKSIKNLVKQFYA